MVHRKSSVELHEEDKTMALMREYNIGFYGAITEIILVLS